MTTNLADLSRRNALKLAGAVAAIPFASGAVAAVARAPRANETLTATPRIAKFFMTDGGTGISTPMAHRVFAIVLVVLATLACAIGLRYIQRDSISSFASH